MVLFTVLLVGNLTGAPAALWQDRGWSADAPTQCSGLPLVQVHGRGSLFDAQHADALASFMAVLPEAVSRTCPGVREVIVVSGRSKQLVRLALAGASSSSGESTKLESRGAVAPSVVKQQVQASRTLTVRSELPRLSSSDKIEDKCETLLQWLRYSEVLPNGESGGQANPMDVFRDEHFSAVFGAVYDETETRWRAELYAKTISRCAGVSGNQPVGILGRYGISSRGSNARLQAFANQFQRYSPLLDGAFQGQDGQFGPTRIIQYVSNVRQGIGTANAMLTTAASAKASKESFDQLGELIESIPRQLAALYPSQQQEARTYLADQRRSFAPQILHPWLQLAEQQPRTLEGARQLVQQFEAFAFVLDEIPSGERGAIEKRFLQVVERAVLPLVEERVSALRAIPSSWGGVEQVVAWRQHFGLEFSTFRSIPAYESAMRVYATEKSRVSLAGLPYWKEQIGRTPLEKPALDQRSRELQALFSTEADRSLPVYSSYANALKVRTEELQAFLTAEARKRQAEQAELRRKEIEALANAPLFGTGSGGNNATPDGAPPFLIYQPIVVALSIGKLDIIPDDQLARRYVYTFGKALNDICGTLGDRDFQSYSMQYATPMLQGGDVFSLSNTLLSMMVSSAGVLRSRGSFGDMVDGMREVTKGLAPGTLPDGGFDGSVVARYTGCVTEDYYRIRTNLRRLVTERRRIAPGADDPERMRSLMNPKFREFQDPSRQ